MCSPVALLAVGTVAQIGGQLYSGVVASQNASYQAQVAGQNRDMANEQAVDAIARGQGEQERHGRDVAQTRGQQIARAAANGVDVSFGSAANMIGDTAELGAEDSQTIADNAYREMRGFEISAANYEAERRSARFAKAQVPWATGLGIAGTVLGSATQFEGLRARRKGV